MHPCCTYIYSVKDDFVDRRPASKLRAATRSFTKVRDERIHLADDPVLPRFLNGCPAGACEAQFVDISRRLFGQRFDRRPLVAKVPEPKLVLLLHLLQCEDIQTLAMRRPRWAQARRLLRGAARQLLRKLCLPAFEGVGVAEGSAARRTAVSVRVHVGRRK